MFDATILHESASSTLCFISPLHTRSAGFGVQVPTTDIPSGDIQVALILLAGTYLGLHLKNIWAPPTVLILWMFSIKPFSGARGIPQLTGGRKLVACNWAQDSPYIISPENKEIKWCFEAPLVQYWWLSSCCSSVAEQWWLKPGILALIPAECQLFTYLCFCLKHLSHLFSVRQDVLSIIMRKHSAWILSWWRFSDWPVTKFWRHILSSSQVYNWGIQYHTCSTYRGLWRLVVVAQRQSTSSSRLSWVWFPAIAGFHYPVIASKRLMQTQKWPQKLSVSSNLWEKHAPQPKPGLVPRPHFLHTVAKWSGQLPISFLFKCAEMLVQYLFLI